MSCRTLRWLWVSVSPTLQARQGHAAYQRLDLLKLGFSERRNFRRAGVL
jgi:hypothetical protein